LWERKIRIMLNVVGSRKLIKSFKELRKLEGERRTTPDWSRPRFYANFDIESGKLNVDTKINTFSLLEEQLDYNKSCDKKFQEWLTKNLDWEEHLDEFPDPVSGEPTLGWERVYSDYPDLDREVDCWYNEDFGLVITDIGLKPVLYECVDELFFRPVIQLKCYHCCSLWEWEEYNVPLYEEGDAPLLDTFPCEIGEYGKKGVVVVNNSGEAFCPICGKGKIEGF